MRIFLLAPLAVAALLGMTDAQATCPPPGAPDLAGHYHEIDRTYIQTTEIVLEKDGRFKYGSFSDYGEIVEKGCWNKQGQTIEIDTPHDSLTAFGRFKLSVALFNHEKLNAIYYQHSEGIGDFLSPILGPSGIKTTFERRDWVPSHLLPADAVAASGQAACAPGDPSMIGHYYLKGVARGEGGSELLLKTNGQFVFAIKMNIPTGADYADEKADIVTGGCWERQKQRIEEAFQSYHEAWAIALTGTSLPPFVSGMRLPIMSDGSLEGLVKVKAVGEGDGYQYNLGNYDRQ